MLKYKLVKHLPVRIGAPEKLPGLVQVTAVAVKVGGRVIKAARKTFNKVGSGNIVISKCLFHDIAAANSVGREG